MSARRSLQKPAQARTVDPVEALPIHLKYRPQKLQDVMGQSATVKALEQQFKKDNPPHAFLFTGPAGTGKTTLSRIIASQFKVQPHNIVEIDAATNNGIDDMRELTLALRYQGFGDTPNKIIILDECHMLTKQAWQSLLKSVEEPPPHIYFAFCTTDAGKVPDTIRTRCAAFNIVPLKHADLLDLLEYVCDQEGFDDCGPKLLNKIISASNGSARQALVHLSNVVGVEDEADIDFLLSHADENKEVIDLCRGLVKGNLEWSELARILKLMPEMTAESIRIVVVNYLNACLMGAKSERDVVRLLDIQHAFSKPCNPTDKMGPLLLAFGQVIFP